MRKKFFKTILAVFVIFFVIGIYWLYCMSNFNNELHLTVTNQLDSDMENVTLHFSGKSPQLLETIELLPVGQSFEYTSPTIIDEFNYNGRGIWMSCTIDGKEQDISIVNYYFQTDIFTGKSFRLQKISNIDVQIVPNSEDSSRISFDESHSYEFYYMRKNDSQENVGK